MRHLVFLLCFFVVYVAPAVAGRPEPYYFKVAYTWPVTSYSPEFDRYVQNLRPDGIASTILTGDQAKVPLSGEVGVYWPITASERYLLVGINCTGFRDVYTQEWDSTTNKWKREAATFFALFSATMQYYPVSRIGSGPFVRLDAGMAMGNMYGRVDNVEYPGKTYLGFGILGGIGYAIPVFTGTHLTAEAWYALRDVEKYSASTLHVGLGVMW